MATHGPCETEGPGPACRHLAPVRDRGHQRRDQAPAAPPTTQTPRTTTKAGAAGGPPAIMAGPGRGARPARLTSYRLTSCETPSLPGGDLLDESKLAAPRGNSGADITAGAGTDVVLLWLSWAGHLPGDVRIDRADVRI